MPNPFKSSADPPLEKGSAGLNSVSGSSSNPFETPGETSQSSTSLPPNRPDGTSYTAAPRSDPAPSRQADTMDVSIPDEPPPAYSSAPAKGGEQSVQTGPARMDFSGPPPIPDRFQNQGHNNYNQSGMEQHITGVGFGYRPEPGQHRLSAQYTGSTVLGAGDGGGWAPPPHPPPGKLDYNEKNEKPMSGQQTGMSNGAGPSRPPPPPDLSPTEIATPGRPLLRKGQLLVYPKNHFCNKCVSLSQTSCLPSSYTMTT